jgi:hypothetical protein
MNLGAAFQIAGCYSSGPAVLPKPDRSIRDGEGVKRKWGDRMMELESARESLSGEDISKNCGRQWAI